MKTNEQPKEIPMYIFMGFLDSGKTKFANETLLDRSFNDGAKTLLLVCEEGEEEYDEKALNKNNIFIEYLDEDTLNTEKLLELSKKYEPEIVLMEYNGLWELDRLFNIRVPKGWTVVQVISFVNASTYDVYVNNMKKIIIDEIRNADMIIFNRCDENTTKSEYRKSIRAVNRRAQVIFENKDGTVDNGGDSIELPFDVESDRIELEEEDFGLFYIDAADNPDKYLGKTIKFKAMVHKPSNYKQNEFVPGRFAMTCCAADIAFIGFKCYYEGAKILKDRDWVMVEGTIDKEFYPEFEGEGPVIKATSVAMTDPAEEELVYFN